MAGEITAEEFEEICKPQTPSSSRPASRELRDSNSPSVPPPKVLSQSPPPPPNTTHIPILQAKNEKSDNLHSEIDVKPSSPAGKRPPPDEESIMPIPKRPPG